MWKVQISTAHTQTTQFNLGTSWSLCLWGLLEKNRWVQSLQPLSHHGLSLNMQLPLGKKCLIFSTITAFSEEETSAINLQKTSGSLSFCLYLGIPFSFAHIQIFSCHSSKVGGVLISLCSVCQPAASLNQYECNKPEIQADIKHKL